MLGGLGTTPPFFFSEAKLLAVISGMTEVVGVGLAPRAKPNRRTG